MRAIHSHLSVMPQSVTARDHHGLGKAENAIADWVTMVMVVEQPAVVAAVAERSLNLGECMRHLL